MDNRELPGLACPGGSLLESAVFLTLQGGFYLVDKWG